MIKAKELELLTQRALQQELLQEKSELIEDLSKSATYRRLLEVEERLKAVNKAETAAKNLYSDAILMAFTNSDCKDHKEFNRQFYDQYHIKLTKNSQVFYDETRIFPVLQWILENGFWDKMVEIKTTGMIKELDNILPVYAKETEPNAPIIWFDWVYGTRIDSGIWRFNDNESIEDENG